MLRQSSKNFSALVIFVAQGWRSFLPHNSTVLIELLCPARNRRGH